MSYLLAASEAPATEYLRYQQLDMSLPDSLVQTGDREAVAKFLDRCAKFDDAHEPLAKWAAEIRSGLNPRMMPRRTVFGQGR